MTSASLIIAGTVSVFNLVFVARRVFGATNTREAPSSMALMPQPRSIDNRDGRLPVKGNFQVEWLAHRTVLLDRAVLRFQNDVTRRTGGGRLRQYCAASDRLVILVSKRVSITRLRPKMMLWP